MKTYSVLIGIVLLSGCAMLKTVRQSDLDAWKGMPVEALDMHSLFSTVPMFKTVTDSGVEIRDYANKRNIGGCVANGYGTNTANTSTMSYSNFNAFKTCSSQMVGCDNLFYIKDGKILEYKPVGRCYTDESVRPEQGWDRFIKSKP